MVSEGGAGACELPRSASERIATRLTNPLGRQLRSGGAHPAPRYYDLEAVEPLLRATATVEIVTTSPHDRGRDTLDERWHRQADARFAGP